MDINTDGSDNLEPTLKPQKSNSLTWVLGTLAGVIGLVTIASYTQGDEQPEQRHVQQEEAGDRETIPLIEIKADDIEKAKLLLKSEPSIIDFEYDASNTVNWTVAVKNDGSKRYGFADYICQILPKNDLGLNDNSVRIVDEAKRVEFGDDYRRYNLGAVRCSDGGYLD